MIKNKYSNFSMLGNQNEYLLELENLIAEQSNNGNDFEKITLQQKLFYLIQRLEREMRNGGFFLYFTGNEGGFAVETVYALRSIGADKTASILESAIEQFPAGIIPTDRSERTRCIVRLVENGPHFWEDLDQRFFKYEDDLNALNIEFILKNQEFFYY